jgi:C4-dicarboxylate-specific signal transduction histidine kinase
VISVAVGPLDGPRCADRPAGVAALEHQRKPAPDGERDLLSPPGAWELYRWQISAGLAALLLQAAIITWLLVERRWRYLAEVEASSRRREVIRLNRVTTASVLSSSIAHEINQPLGAILSNTEAAQKLLKIDPPDLAKIDEILSDIIRDEQRAGEIIIGLRNLLDNRSDAELHALDLNDTVPELVKIVTPEVVKREIALSTILAPETLLVRADPIHIATSDHEPCHERYGRHGRCS